MGYNDCVYILTVYKIIVRENDTHLVSHIQELKDSKDIDKISLLKNHKQNISEILFTHVEPLYNEIISIYGTIDSCQIIEICRHICDSVNIAKKIAEQLHRINNNDISCKYMCYKCNLYVNTEYQWIRHISSPKHYERITAPNNELFHCNKCNKYFLSRSYLWTHAKTCTKIPTPRLHIPQHHLVYDITHTNSQAIKQEIKKEIIDDISTLLQDNNQVVIDKMAELHQTSVINNHSNNTTNNTNCHNTNITNNNNHFNLNFFLNETCKNAITIKEFIENIHVGVDTVEYTGRHGYVAGISKIITNELNKLGLQMRPIHCTDLKRETMYIKDDNGWEKDNEEKEKLNKAIMSVVKKNMRQINQWRIENPNCEVNDSLEYNFEIDIMKECMGDSYSEKADHRKICTQIAKSTSNT